MSDNLEARIATLEAEVKRLKELVESITIEEVAGDLNIGFNGSADGVSICMGDVEGDVSVGLAGGANGLHVSTGDIEGDIGFGITGAANGIEVTTCDVGGDVCCSGVEVGVKSGEDG